MEYIGEEVKAKLEGKICSYDKSVPDCLCAIYLTDNHIFVSEDNFDGTYEDHYVFPLSNVTDVLMEQPANVSGKNSDAIRKSVFETSRAERSITTKLLDTFRKEKYFTIVSKDATGNTTKTYFILASGGESKFISEFKKLNSEGNI